MTDKTVCSTTHVFHYMINPEMNEVQTFLENGIRPLSDFPESARWQQIHKHMPDFYENLYYLIAQPILLSPYSNSGIFVTPIDFRKLPGTELQLSPRFKIPLDRLDPQWTVVTYVLFDERISMPFDLDVMKEVSRTWKEDLVRKWFGIDRTKLFFYVPQVAAYQGKIEVYEADFELN